MLFTRQRALSHLRPVNSAPWATKLSTEDKLKESTVVRLDWKLLPKNSAEHKVALCGWPDEVTDFPGSQKGKSTLKSLHDNELNPLLMKMNADRRPGRNSDELPMKFIEWCMYLLLVPDNLD